MTDVVAIGELLIDFTCKSVDAEGYPTMEAHPGMTREAAKAEMERYFPQLKRWANR